MFSMFSLYVAQFHIMLGPISKKPKELKIIRSTDPSRFRVYP